MSLNLGLQRPASSRTPTVRRSRRLTNSMIAATALAYLLTFVVLLPLLWVGFLSLQPSSHILDSPFNLHGLGFGNFRTAVKTLGLVTMYKNTLILAVGSVPIGIVVSYMAAFALTRMVLEGRARLVQSGIRYFLIAGLAIPVYAILFPIYRIDIALHLFGTYGALIAPYVAVAIPFNTLLFTGFLTQILPELEQSAILDGASMSDVAWRIVFPLMKPVVVTLTILNVIYVWNEFPFAVTLIDKSSLTTISLAVSQFQGQYTTDYGAMMASAVLVLLPQLAFFAIFQRQVIAGMTTGAVR
jgi:raffinose/stachyose/melibiose transport system permease protein